MSDKKMNDFPTAADGAFVYAEDANGNQIKISKADLASVVAELNKQSNQIVFSYSANTEYDTGITYDGLFRINIGDVAVYFVKQGTEITYINSAWVTPYLKININSNKAMVVFYTVSNTIGITFLG